MAVFTPWYLRWDSLNHLWSLRNKSSQASTMPWQFIASAAVHWFVLFAVCYVLKVELSGMYALSLYFLEKLILVHLMQMNMMQHATFDTRHLLPTVGSMCSRSYLHPWLSLGKSRGFQVWIEWQHYRIRVESLRWQELSMKIMADMIVIVRIILYHSHDDIEQSR